MALELYALTQDAMAGLEVELVDVERAPGGLLRVTIDKPEGVRIEDCERVSRHLSRVYEVEGVDYRRLEVGSPGVDRPLKRVEDFTRFAGHRIEVRLRQAIDNRKVFTGMLQVGAPEAQDSEFGLEYETQTGELQLLRFRLEDIERAKLDPILDFKGKKR